MVDSENVAKLGEGLLARKRAKLVGNFADSQERHTLLREYARVKLEAIIAWAKAGRKFFVTQQEADAIKGGWHG